MVVVRGREESRTGLPLDQSEKKNPIITRLWEKGRRGPKEES